MVKEGRCEPDENDVCGLCKQPVGKHDKICGVKVAEALGGIFDKRREDIRALFTKYGFLLSPRLGSYPRGWDGLVERIFQVLREREWTGEFLGFKEKFGTLSFYISGAGETQEIVNKIAAESYRTCEVCGQPGENSSWGRSWIRTLCPEHANLYQEKGSAGLRMLLLGSDYHEL